ncbi:MAG: hypothetical protein ACQEVT_04580 [Pseudomonadota bacterium]
MYYNEFPPDMHPPQPYDGLLSRITHVQHRLDSECHALGAQIAHHEKWRAALGDDRALLNDPEQILTQDALIDTLALRLQTLRQRLAARNHDASLLRQQGAVALAAGGVDANTPALARLLAEADKNDAATNEAGAGGSEDNPDTATGWDSLPDHCRPGASSGIPRPARIGPRGFLPRVFDRVGGLLKIGAILFVLVGLLNALGGGAFNQRSVGNARFSGPGSGSGLPQITTESTEFNAAGSVLLKLVSVATGGSVDIEAITRRTADSLRGMSP